MLKVLLALLLQGQVNYSSGQVPYGYIGIHYSGRLIHKVFPNSPAERAGILKGDRFTNKDMDAIDGPAYEEVEVDIDRHGQQLVFYMIRVPHKEAFNE